MENPQTISALEDPDQANQLAAAALSASADLPEIEPPPDGTVILPGGYLDPQGELHTEAAVRELNGADQEALFKPEVIKSMARWTQLLLQRGVVRIGPLDNPSNAVLGSLLLGDRDMLLLAIRRVTYGHTLDMAVTCPACGDLLEFTHDLTKVEIRPMDNPMERSFTHTLRGGETCTVNLAVGSDQESILTTSANKSLAEICTQLLARCVVKDGRPLGVEGARALGIQDRQKLMKELTDRQPGPQYSKVDLDCGACGKEFPMIIDLQDLFR